MTITKKAEKYSSFLKTGKRDNGDSFIYLAENSPKKLHDSIMNAHDDKLPNDWTFGTYADLLQKVTEYNLKTVEDLEDVRHEIVDGYVDIYTSQLTKWLSEDIGNVEYVTEVMEEETAKDGFQLLAQAQYKAIDEVMGYVIDLLS